MVDDGTAKRLFGIVVVVDVVVAVGNTFIFAGSVLVYFDECVRDMGIALTDDDDGVVVDDDVVVAVAVADDDVVVDDDDDAVVVAVCE